MAETLFRVHVSISPINQTNVPVNSGQIPLLKTTIAIVGHNHVHCDILFTVHSAPSPWRPWLINWEYITQRVNLLLCLPLVHTPDATDSYHSQHQCHYYWGTHTSRRLYNNCTNHQTTLESAMSTAFQYGSRT